MVPDAFQHETAAGTAAVSQPTASPVDFNAYGTIYHSKGLPSAPSHLREHHHNSYPFRDGFPMGGRTCSGTNCGKPTSAYGLP